MTITSAELRSLIREVAESSDHADPGGVAAEVMEKIAPGDYRDALAITLRDFVRVEIGNARRVTPKPPTSDALPASGNGPIYSSRKIAAIRSWWDKLQRERINMSNTDWKFMRDCTRDDLIYAANYRRSLAAANINVAERLERIASRVGDGVVGDLNPSALEDIA